MKRIFLISVIAFLSASLPAQSIKKNGRITVTKDGHYFQYEDGTPFLWLADTGWELFTRLTLKEIEAYFDNRVAKGFNVIQAVILSENDLAKVDRNGNHALDNNDPLKPSERYFSFIDKIIQVAASKNLVLALVASWGDKVVPQADGSSRVIFDSSSAKKYGTYLGKRFKQHKNIIWIMGGDNPVERNSISYLPVFRNMAEGIIEGTGHPVLITYHPNGFRSSSPWVHNEPWLDFNMIQTSHGQHDAPVWRFIKQDRAKLPTKPTLDAEPNYEDHPVNPWPKWNVDSGYFRDYDVRKQLYRCVFAGGAGVTYGHHAVWQFASERTVFINYPDRGWVNAIDRPGAFQAGYMKKLVESRPMKERVPDETMIISGQSDSASRHMEAYRDKENTYAMIYLPVGKTIRINTNFIKSTQVIAWWFNPNDASIKKIGSIENKTENEFTSPTTGPGNDWVLIVERPGYKLPF